MWKSILIKVRSWFSLFKLDELINFMMSFTNKELIFYILFIHSNSLLFHSMDGADLCFEIVNRVHAGFVYSEAVARWELWLLMYPLVSKLDQWLISPYCILALSKRQLMRIKCDHWKSCSQPKTCKSLRQKSESHTAFQLISCGEIIVMCMECPYTVAL